MIGFAIAVVVLLIVAILIALFRLHTLVGVMKGQDKKRVGKSNKTNAVLLLLFVIVGFILLFWYSISEFDNYTLPVASKHGVTTDNLFWVTMAITGVVFIITQILLFYFPFKYQFKEKGKALYYPENNKLEIIWTVVPAIALTALVLYGLIVWNNIMTPPPDNAEVIEVMGQQFIWKVRYPGKDGKLGKYDFRKIDLDNEFGMDFSDKASFDDFTPRMLHLPKGRPVEIKIRAKDVLHSFYLPQFRVKMDAVPGMPTRFTFTPTKTTEEMREETGNPDFNYELACAEVCGRGHFSMRLIVKVEEPEEYDKWYAEQESWLSQHPDYMAKVPDDLKKVALAKANIEKELVSK